MKRAGIYARVSTMDQDVEMQLVDLRARAKAEGCKVSEYVDVGVSGAKSSRPQLNKLMEDATSGKLDLVLVWKFDRFARNTRHLLTALDTFKEHGVDFISVREAIDTTSPAGKMFFTIVAAFAEFERETIRERVMAGQQLAKANGKHIGRPRKPMPLEAAQELLASGHSQRNIAEMLGVSRTSLRRALSTGA